MKHIKWLAPRTQVHSGRVRGSDKNRDSVGYMGDCPVLAGLVSGGFVSTQLSSGWYFVDGLEYDQVLKVLSYFLKPYQKGY